MSVDTSPEAVERLCAPVEKIVNYEYSSRDALIHNCELGTIDMGQLSDMCATLRALLAERDALQGQLDDLRNGWANSVKAHADALAERDAAFAAGQESMRERAARDVAEFGRLYLGNGDDVTVDVVKDIHALSIKDSPDGR